MRHRHASAAAVGIMWLAPILLSGQAPITKTNTPAKTSWKVPRTQWGDPDLQGTWNNSTTTPLERPGGLSGKEFLTPQEAAERDELAERTADDAPRAGDPGTYNGFWFDRGKIVAAHVARRGTGRWQTASLHAGRAEAPGRPRREQAPTRS